MTNILKYKNKIIAGVVAFVMVFSVLVFVSPTEAQAVSINATDTGFYNLANGANGATTFTNGDTFKVVNTMRSTKNKATYTTTDGTNWTTADAFVWNGGTAMNQFQAWYPATATASYDSFTLPTGQSAGIEDADWMTASTNEIAKPADGMLNLNFSHLLSKVTVNITEWNSEFGNEEQEVGDPIIYSKGTYLTANYNDDGSVTITSTGENTEITPVVNGDKTSYTAIVAPVKYNTSDTFMTFTVNGQAMTVLAKATALTEGLQAGYHYTFDLTVGKEAVSIETVLVTPWTQKDIDGGVAEEDFSSINATNMSTDDLNAAVTMALETGVTDLTITLATDAPAGMFTAIRRALINTDAQGINLTLAGVTEIPEHNQINSETAIFGPVDGDDIIEEVTQLASINLPDVVTIGSWAFASCRSLASVTAPKVQTIGEDAFGGTALTSVELPEATTIGAIAFTSCYSLATVKLPSATSIDIDAFQNCESMTYLELTAEGEVELGNDVFDDPSFSIDVDLVLHANKKSQVTFNDDSTAIWNGYTFKSITFVGE